MTPLRRTTLQCSQIGLTLVRTFTKTSSILSSAEFTGFLDRL